MTSVDTSVVDRPWPADGLERVEHCPFCGSGQRALAYGGVQDWSFYAAPGRWDYWDCLQCQSMYLDPRPTPATIGDAYRIYYTHRVVQAESMAQQLKERLRNEAWSHWLKIDLHPRLGIPRALGWMLRPLRSRLIQPFEIATLAGRPAGRLMDVGCGHGHTLSLAEQLGWRVMGLEPDPSAATAARSRGLEVVEGFYPRLAEFKGEFDCIICSHVLEHVHDPRDLMVKLAEALRPGGLLLLTTPNATSRLRQHFGSNWRGLEAPRHLAIGSSRQLEADLRELGFRVRQRPETCHWTAAESSRIERRDTELTAHDMQVYRDLTASLTVTDPRQYDFIQFVCEAGDR